jgi:hypothetical protein
MTAPRQLMRASASDSFASDSVALTARRLGAAAAITAAVELVYLVLYRTVWSAAGNAVSLSSGVISLVVSAAAAAYLFGGQRPRSRVVLVGVSFELFLALMLALTESWSVSYGGPSAQVSWVAVIIVLFPFLIPARPRVILATSLLAAVMQPLGMVVMFWITGRAWPPSPVTMSYVLPPFLCALLAWVPTVTLYRLETAVQGARRLGNYELSERLGQGGMGEVWRARHRLLARAAAVKLIKPEVLGARDTRSREVMMQRFEQEAQITASLDSPHTVELYDFGVSSDGVLFYVMELLSGVDLETLVERFGPLPPERVVHLLMQACDSLEDAHGRGLIHRDIKPANLFVSRKGSTSDFVKLLDFGLAKRWHTDDSPGLLKSLEGVIALDGTGDAVQQTAAGQIVGTPAYLAPEALLGEQAVDARADIYALGCVAYWLLTGTLVFAESSPLRMAVAHITQVPRPPSRLSDRPLPAPLERLVLACLEKDREQRPRSAEALRQALAAVPLPEPWSRERAASWWRENLPA